MRNSKRKKKKKKWSLLILPFSLHAIGVSIQIMQFKQEIFERKFLDADLLSITNNKGDAGGIEIQIYIYIYLWFKSITNVNKKIGQGIQ